MSESFAGLIWTLAAVYFGLGAVISVPVAAFMITKIDPHGAPLPLRVRLVLLPGMIALWPVILARLTGRKPFEDQP